MAFNKSAKYFGKFFFTIVIFFTFLLTSYSCAKATETLIYQDNTILANWGFANDSIYGQRLGSYFSTTTNITAFSLYLTNTSQSKVFKCEIRKDYVPGNIGTIIATTTVTVPIQSATWTTCRFATTSIVGLSNIAISYYYDTGSTNSMSFGVANTSGDRLPISDDFKAWIRPAGSIYYTGQNNAFAIYSDVVSTCTSWTYSNWLSCTASGTQSRTIASSSPAGCSGGSPILSQSCTYSPPLVYATTTYNIDGDMTKIGTTVIAFITKLYQQFWPFILAFAIVSGFGYAISKIFKKII